MNGSNQTTATVTTGAGAVATIAVFIASQLGVDITPEVAAAIATLFVLVAGFFHKPAAAE